MVGQTEHLNSSLEFLVELKKEKEQIILLIDSSTSDDRGQYLREFFTYSSNQMK